MYVRIEVITPDVIKQKSITFFVCPSLCNLCGNRIPMVLENGVEHVVVADQLRPITDSGARFRYGQLQVPCRRPDHRSRQTSGNSRSVELKSNT